jgi:23S rRNA (adenine2503-C2)-methyltransferase
MQSSNQVKSFLLDYTRQELKDYVQDIQLERFRGDQIFRGIYVQSLDNINNLSTISKTLRNQLKERTVLRTFTPVKTTRSPHDKTTKFLWELSDGLKIESVIIYEGKRITFCISSQVGCALDCRFCATGKMGFLRNLTAGEIVEQVLRMRALAEGPTTNIVFMGMGEPMLNYKNVRKACDIISDPEGLAFGRKKITISTSGVIPGIKKMAEESSPYSLAISLNAVFEDKRRHIMPVSGQYPLQDLFSTLEYYVQTTGKRVTFEYILIAGKNDSQQDADQLLRLTARIPCKINLIPCNSLDPEFPPPDKEKVRWFNEYLNQKRRTATTRMRKGWEIQAACGQLYSTSGAGVGSKITDQVKKEKSNKKTE